MKKFGKILKKKLKPLMVTKKLNMGKIFKKLGLRYFQMILYMSQYKKVTVPKN